MVGTKECTEAKRLRAQRHVEQVVVGGALLRFSKDAIWVESGCCHIPNIEVQAETRNLGDVTQLPELSSTGAALREHVLTHSVKRGEFTLKSGAKSSWFLDTKQTACRPDGIVLVAEALLDILPSDATAIGGLTMGADPVAFGVAAVAATKGRMLRSFSVRKEAKDH